ncbi:MAG: cysteine hydrolase family protein [Chloroflexota bacterium]
MLEIEKDTTALLIMDVQNDIVHEDGKYKDFGNPAHAAERNIFDKLQAVLAKAREEGLKVIHVKFGMRDFEAEVEECHAPILKAVAGMGACDLDAWGGEIHDSVRPIEGEDIIEKNRVDAFIGTNLEEILEEAGIETLLMGGVATNWVVEATARHAADDDYRVVIVEDGCSSMNQAMHDFSIENILSNVAEISSSDEVIQSL